VSEHEHHDAGEEVPPATQRRPAGELPAQDSAPRSAEPAAPEPRVLAEPSAELAGTASADPEGTSPAPSSSAVSSRSGTSNGSEKETPAEGNDEGTIPAEAGGDDLTLRDWREPPTGEVPRIIEDLAGVPADELAGPRTGELPLIEEDPTVPLDPPRASHVRRRIYGGREARTEDHRGSVGEGVPARSGPRRTRAHVVRERRERGRSKLQSTLTGVVLAVIVVVAALLGRLELLVVVGLALELATSEAFNVLARARSGEARFLGFLGVGALLEVAYAKGDADLAGVLAAVFVATAAWYVVGPLKRPPFEGIAHTLGIVLWVGLCGSFAGLLLRPRAFDGHGELVLIAALAATVGEDTLAFFVGSRLGRHKLAPRLSPGKTVEGLAGGALGALLVGALVGLVHPLGLARGLVLGAAVAVVGPIGDLVESAFKRQFEVKDSGTLLPGHGGVLDRIDAMLFVLPVAYAVAMMTNLR